MNNSDLFHSWAHQRKDYATGSNCSYTGKVCYSYRQPIGMLIELGDKTLAILSSSNHSVTTSKHQGLAWGAVHNLYPVISTEYDFRALVDKDFDIIFSKVEKDYLDSIDNLLDELSNKRKKAVKIINSIGLIFNSLKTLYRFKDVEFHELSLNLASKINDYKRFDVTFNNMDVWFQYASDTIYNSYRQPVAQKSAEEIIQNWRNNKRQGLGKLRLHETILRYVPQKEIIQTSKGITFSTAQAKEFWHDIQNVIQSGVEKSVTYLGFSGVIKPDGSLKIGCHEISHDEVLNLAQILQF